MQPRFRAIDPETGKVSEVFEVSPRHQMDIKDKSFYQFCCQGVTFITQSAPILSQSTGLNDARGNEVFEGDIIYYMSNGGPRYFVVVYRGSGYCMDGWLDTTGSGYHLTTMLTYCRVIGNKYESQSTLEQRARDVMNG